jgi:hypothetical protein
MRDGDYGDFPVSQLRAVSTEEHDLQAGRPAGHVLWQGVYQQKLKDRASWIGWDAMSCANKRRSIRL